MQFNCENEVDFTSTACLLLDQWQENMVRFMFFKYMQISALY